MKVKFLELPDSVQQVVDSTLGARQALRRLDKGSKSTPESPFFYEHWSSSKVLNTCKNSLTSIQDPKLRVLVDWDLGFEPKFGPLGEAAPLLPKYHTRMKNFNEYFEHTDEPSIISDPVWDKAIREAVRRLGFNRTGKPITVDEVIARGFEEDKYNTNAAYNTYRKKKDPLAQRAAKEDAPHAIQDRFPNTPATRSTPGKVGEECRNIFMTAFSVVVNGQRYQIPVQEYVRSKHIEYFTPWEGWSDVQYVCSGMAHQTWKLSADYDKMDQHFNRHHGKQCFRVLKEYFKPQYWDELEQIIDYVFTQPILTNLGYIDQDHALVSGSEWTNFLETIWNFIFWIYVELKYHIKCRHAMGIGDDQLIEFLGSEVWTPKKADKILDLIIWLYDRAGTPGNKDKNLFARDTFEFCQRKAISSWKGPKGDTPWALVYRLLRWADLSKHPERFHNDKFTNEKGEKEELYNKFTFVYSLLMRTENLVQSPRFDWACEFGWHSNPAVKEFMLLSDAKIQEQVNRARKISSLGLTYNQEKKDKPIFQFETFKKWRQMAQSQSL